MPSVNIYIATAFKIWGPQSVIYIQGVPKKTVHFVKWLSFETGSK